MTTTATDPVDEELAELLETGEMSARPTWTRLVVQPACVAAMFVGVAIYVQVADLSKVESRLLNIGTLVRLTREHIQVSFMAALVVVVIAIPLGIVLTRSWARGATTPAILVANIGQAAPSIGLIVLCAMWLQVGFRTGVIGLTVYGVLPSLHNTITGLRQVDQRQVEAARGMGMSAVGTLLRVELPLAVPVILTGVRVSLVLIVGTASLVTFVGAGGLGTLVVTGVTLGRTSILFVGAITIAALALLIDWLGKVVEEIARPKGLS